MKNYEMIIIGFGKAGKTLAKYFAKKGKKIAMIEKDSMMYGGTCINIACIPTKTLIQSVESGSGFHEAYEYRDKVTEKLRNKNYNNLAEEDNIDIYNGQASFINNNTINISTKSKTIDIAGDIIIINTGTLPSIPKIDGINNTKNIYHSTSIQDLREQANVLGIIGAGNIGLEFASLYSQMGSRVYLFNRNESILINEEAELVDLAVKYLQEDGVELINNFNTTKLSNDDKGKVIIESEDSTYTVDALLVATGRTPNIDNLGLQNTDIKLDKNGYIKINENLETSVSGIYAVGDINGGPQFTYISLDDYRIVKNHIEGDTSYNLNNRKNVPYTYFLNPPYARVGLTEKEAKDNGYKLKVNSMDVANMPRGHVNNDLRGRFKLVVNDVDNSILGASLFGDSSEELINLIKMAMDNNIPYTYIRDQVFTHPTMAENLNDLFNI